MNNQRKRWPGKLRARDAAGLGDKPPISERFCGRMGDATLMPTLMQVLMLMVRKKRSPDWKAFARLLLLVGLGPSKLDEPAQPSTNPSSTVQTELSPAAPTGPDSRLLPL